jgi:cbb3-type cytochrome oxidase maturation protein
MDILVWLVPLALLMGFLGLVGFLWNLRSGQYEDLDGAASRILFDDDRLPPASRPAARPAAHKETRP